MTKIKESLFYASGEPCMIGDLIEGNDASSIKYGVTVKGVRLKVLRADYLRVKVIPQNHPKAIGYIARHYEVSSQYFNLIERGS